MNLEQKRENSKQYTHCRLDLVILWMNQQPTSPLVLPLAQIINRNFKIPFLSLFNELVRNTFCQQL